MSSSRSSEENEKQKNNNRSGNNNNNNNIINLTLAQTQTQTNNSEPCITPDELLRLVHQMRIDSRNRQTSKDLMVHSRATSNASSTYDDLHLMTASLSQSTLSNGSTTDHQHQHQHQHQHHHHHHQSQPQPKPQPQPPLSLHIPDSRSLDSSRAMPETLDLSHQRIADLTQPVVQELAEYVERLALGYNYLPVLPDHFAILGESLRYLNLRGNHMEIFPDVLTRMPSLEILDVSRNKIKAFPRRPGSLDRLRVLSVSRNRIKRLPNYVANLTTLRVLKIDHNPVIWPPKELITFIDACERPDEDETDPQHHHHRPRDQHASSSSHMRTRTPSNETSSTSMALWLRTLQDWMRKNPYVRPVKQTRPSTSETTGDPSEYGGLRSTLDFERSFNNFKGAHSPDISPVMTLSSGPAYSPNTNTSLQNSSHNKSYDHMVQHNRNASSSSSSQWVRKRPELRLKKSLPDLRRNHAEIMVERSADVERAYFGLNRSPHMIPPNSSSSVTFSLNSPALADRGPRSAMALSNDNPSTPAGLTTTNPSPTTASQVTFKNADLARSGGTQIRRIQIGTSGDEDSLAGDRNSGAYFRRLSMLPASTISKQVPTPLLQLMDGIRGILFSLSQIYAALKQFVMFATQDRLPGALSRMTSAADDSMGKLINSLDRFDSSTRRAQPELEVVQQVFKSCRDNVIVFGKLVNVLSIQLKVLMGSADVRYSRTLLLSLYGATAEIAMSWQMITPLVDDVISLPSLKKSKPPSAPPPPPPPPTAPPPILHDSTDDSSFVSSPCDFLQKGSSAMSSAACEIRRTASRENLQPDPESFSSKHAFEPLKNLLNSSTGSPSNFISPGPASSAQNKGRRHAGSFIAEDVQMGTFIPPASAGLANNHHHHRLPSHTLPLPSYSPFPPSPSPSYESNGSFGSAMKPDGLSGTALNDEPRSATTTTATSRNNNAFNRSPLDPLSLGPPSLPMLECTKPSLDSYPSVLSPGGSLPRSPALTSIASLTTNTVPFAVEPTAYNTASHHESSGGHPDLMQHHSQAANQWAPPPSRPGDVSSSSRVALHHHQHPHPHQHSGRSASTTMVDIPERTTSRNHHARFDSSLSRTDQDFLDMTEATVEIALSVTSMMLENLGQASLETSASSSGPLSSSLSSGPSGHHAHHHHGHHPHPLPPPNHHHHHHANGSAEHETNGARQDSSHSRRERKGTTASSLTKAGELKELCEVEIEVIRRLRASLAAFWQARSAATCSHFSHHHPHPHSHSHHPHHHHHQQQQQNQQHQHQLARDMSSGSLASSASASTFSSSTTIPDLHIPSSSSASSSSSSFLPGHPHDYHHLRNDPAAPPPPPPLALAESKKVFDDATAFVRAVIQTANLARATMTEYPLSKAIREGLGELTKATKELATLLAVSSFKAAAPSSSSSFGSLVHSASASSNLPA
ncbi:hypothetical protein PCASD_19578 [Puccinia coronata f. sp. avenae]|uniref:RAM signaling network component n=1 Tax=Puccinia coronata f. sp. avenae TaxID=200324 RepID=A0A2N5TUW1_9BASI|nr:hypothetical protein PCASD_19578 [Puccinia coronata f. sp. avenae]